VSCERAAQIVDPADIDPRDAHVAGCADCQVQLAALRRIAGAMRDVGSTRQRAPDHLARVWATLDRAPASSRRARTTIVAATAVVLAAAAALLVWLRTPARPPRFEIDIVDGQSAPIRGDAHLGDRLRIRARAGASVGVRVYRNDRELLLECPRMCRRDGGAYVGDVTLDAVARYQVLWLDGTMPAARSPDEDVAAASSNGARFELRELEVR
jgi:hypothetical protein